MIELKHVSYTYPQAESPVLRDVSLHLAAGSFSLVVGPSGVGKSTLIRCLNGLVPHFSGGHLQGRLRVDGLDPVDATPEVMSRHVGFVFQDPESQFVVDRVEDEIAFALENAAVPLEEMAARVAQVLELLALTTLRDRPLESLSGGEKQRVAIAAALALQPKILVLDEPTSQLDPVAADQLLQSLVRLNRELGLTIVLVEHRLERVLPYADTMIYLPEDGHGIVVGSPREILWQMKQVAPLIALARRLDWHPLPLTVAEGRRFARELPRPLPPAPANGEAKHSEQPAIHVQDVTVAYGANVAVDDVDLTLWPGQLAVLMGPNGAGKTSLLKSLVGLVQPRAGQIQVQGEDIRGRDTAEICRQVGYLPQDPNALLFADTVREELLITLENHGLSMSEDQEVIVPPDALLDRLGLMDKAEAYPRDLSVGERQRVALGAITVTKPAALLLDEPTRGLDYRAKATLVELLHGWRDEGMAILVVTHDVEFAAAAADRICFMTAGRILVDGAPRQVLDEIEAFSPQIAELFPDTNWLTAADVLQALIAR
jgi:energy-coupling factor transport system ATP-binding protein